jgi:hypothetical protein
MRVTATARTCSACALESRRSPQYGRPERDITRLPEKIGPPVWRSSSARWSKIPTGWAARCAPRGQLAGLRSARGDSYRITFNVDDERRRVDIVHIDHRGDVYR